MDSPTPFNQTPTSSPRLRALRRPSISSLPSLIAPPSPAVPFLPTAPAPDPYHHEYPPITRRNVVSFILALICCGSAGAIALFSMFAPAMQNDTGLKVMEINLIAIAGELGQYVPVPLIGFVGDRYGPSCIGVLSTFLFTPGFYISSMILKSAQQKMKDGLTENLVTPNELNILIVCFFCIGAATSSLHFCGVVTAAKVLPQSPGLSISGPIAAYGISCLWLSQLVSHVFTEKASGMIRLIPVFQFFAILYLITGVISYAAAHTGTFLVSNHPDYTNQTEDTNPFDETRSLLSSTSHLDLTQPFYGSAPTPVEPPKPQRSSLSEFFHDPTVWIFFASFVLATGPLEMFVNDMGMILNTIPNNSIFGLPVGSHVSIFSAFSTLARLSMGLIAELLAPVISRANLFGVLILLISATHFMFATGVLTVVGQGKYFYLASAANGFSYGSCFTLTPTIVAAIWGLENYGTNWGTFILGPSIGATFYGYLFAKVYQSNAAGSGDDINNLESAGMFLGRKAAEFTSNMSTYLNSSSSSSPDDLQCFGLKCYQTTFITTGFGFVLAAMLLMSVYRFNWKPLNRLGMMQNA